MLWRFKMKLFETIANGQTVNYYSEMFHFSYDRVHGFVSDN